MLSYASAHYQCFVGQNQRRCQLFPTFCLLTTFSCLRSNIRHPTIVLINHRVCYGCLRIIGKYIVSLVEHYIINKIIGCTQKVIICCFIENKRYLCWRKFQPIKFYFVDNLFVVCTWFLISVLMFRYITSILATCSKIWTEVFYLENYIICMLSGFVFLCEKKWGCIRNRTFNWTWNISWFVMGEDFRLRFTLQWTNNCFLLTVW